MNKISDRGFMALCDNLSTISGLHRIGFDSIIYIYLFLIIDNQITSDGVDYFIEQKSCLPYLKCICTNNEGDGYNSDDKEKIKEAFPNIAINKFENEDFLESDSDSDDDEEYEEEYEEEDSGSDSEDKDKNDDDDGKDNYRINRGNPIPIDSFIFFTSFPGYVKA